MKHYFKDALFAGYAVTPIALALSTLASVGAYWLVVWWNTGGPNHVFIIVQGTPFDWLIAVPVETACVATLLGLFLAWACPSSQDELVCWHCGKYPYHPHPGP